MVVLVDPPSWPAHGRRWSHLASDADLEELHAFARAAGVPARGFEGDHYDVPAERYDDLVAAGAVPVSSRELLSRLVAAGLRRPKRKGERVVASAHGPRGRTDAITSALPPPGGGVVEARALDVVGGRVRLDVGGALPPHQVPARGPDGGAAAPLLGHLRTTPPSGRLVEASYSLLVAAPRPDLPLAPVGAVVDPLWRALVEALASEGLTPPSGPARR